MTEQQKETNKLFVGNLSWDTKWWDLKEFFGQFGEVAYASTAFDREKRRPRGFGFVTFVNEADAAKAKEAAADGELVLHERPLFIDFAIPKDDDDRHEADEDKSLLEKAEDTIEDAAETVADAAEDAVEKAGELLDDAGDAIEEALD